MFQSPGAVAFTLGSIDIHWYGIVMSLAILCGIFVILFIRSKFFEEITADSIFDLSFVLIIWGIISARLYYVLLDYKYFLRFPLEIPAVWNGGISIQGALLGGIIAGIIYAKKHNINFFRYADLYVFGLTAGQIIGRWGNFFNSEAFGLPCNLPWKLFIPYNARPLEYKLQEYFHPAFLYESILSLIIFAVLYLVLLKTAKRTDGVIFYLYIILYSIVRIGVESIRTDSVLNIFNFHAAHLTAVIFITAAVIGLYFLFKGKSKHSL